MESHKFIPEICIVGRPNVGKSSLFNYLLGERRAVVVEQSGTTRDRLEAVIHISGQPVKIVDTGGYLTSDKCEISMQVKEQILRAMEEASIIIMVTDVIDGISPYDEEVAFLLRKYSKSVILVANKTDNDKLKNDALEFYQLGFGEPETVACVHRRGVRKLKRRIRESLESMSGVEKKTEKKSTDRYIKVAIVGRPNVGKSSFINNLLKRNRVIVSDIPGTTRDSIDTHFRYKEDDYILIDTAGIRHKRKVKEAVDVFSMMRSRESIGRADVVILLLDAADGITTDDIDILNYIEEKGKACLIAINKWDLAENVGDISMEDYKARLVVKYSQLGKFPILSLSSKTGKNVISSLSQVNVLDANLDFKTTTPFLNKIFEKNNPSGISISRKKKKPNFLYMVQIKTRPIEFKYFVSNPKNVLTVHLNFIENRLRAKLPLSGIPIKIRIRRSKKEKY